MALIDSSVKFSQLLKSSDMSDGQFAAMAFLIRKILAPRGLQHSEAGAPSGDGLNSFREVFERRDGESP